MARNLPILMLILAGFGGCKAAGPQLSRNESLAANRGPKVKNIASFKTARILHDHEKAENALLLPRISAAVREIAGRNEFTFSEKFDQTRAEILGDLEADARAVGVDGTLFWYVSSHGQGGKLRTYDAQTIQPKELVDAIRRGRTFEGKVIPFRRLYMLQDFCDAGVSAKGIITEVQPTAIDLGALRTPDIHNTTLVEALDGTTGSVDDAGVSLTGPESKTVLFKEALIFSSTSDIQSTYQFVFQRALIESMTNLVKGNSGGSGEVDPTIGDLLAAVAAETAKTQQSTAGPVSKTPQRVMFYALPDNSLLAEPLFPGKTPQERNKEPCPKWLEKDWNYTHSRDAKGACLKTSSYCKCYQLAADPRDDYCHLTFPKSDERLSGERVSADDAGRNSCYRTCDKIVAEHREEFDKNCAGKLIMINPNRRVEFWDYTTESK